MTRRVLWVDTSFLYALFVEADQNHQHALQLWKRCVEERLASVTHSLVYAEFGTLLAYRYGHGIAFQKTALLYDSSLVRCVRSDAEVETGALQWWRRFADQRFSFADCVSFEFMRRLGVARALTYDRDYALAGYVMVSSVGDLQW